MAPGVYALWCGDACLYVGMSTRSIRSRIHTHLKQLTHQGITKVSWRRCARPAWEECALIFLLDPPLNVTAKETL